MKKIYSYWEDPKTGETGYCEADITFTADAFDESVGDTVWYSKDCKTLKTAISEARKYFQEHRTHNVNVYANAELTERNQDGTVRHKPLIDGARLGTIWEDGSYFDLCENVPWLQMFHLKTMDKQEFINKFSDKDKIEIAENYLSVMYDRLVRNDYCQKVAQSDLDTQTIRNTIQGITGNVPHLNGIPLYTMM